MSFAASTRRLEPILAAPAPVEHPSRPAARSRSNQAVALYTTYEYDIFGNVTRVTNQAGLRPVPLAFPTANGEEQGRACEESKVRVKALIECDLESIHRDLERRGQSLAGPERGKHPTA
ncbi:MAG: hypothetical protein AB7O52_19710 [Planctomycetota bacterium]